VDADRGEDDPEDQRHTAGEGGRRNSPEGEHEGGQQQPAEQRQPDDAVLGCDRHRRVVGSCGLRLLALQARPLRVRLLEAADADPLHGVMRRDRDAVLDELEAASRG